MDEGNKRKRENGSQDLTKEEKVEKKIKEGEGEIDGEEREIDGDNSQNSQNSVSSMQFSPDLFDNGIPIEQQLGSSTIFVFDSNDTVKLLPDGKVISGTMSDNIYGSQQFNPDLFATDFATTVNETTSSLIHQVENLFDTDDDTIATELSTGFSQTVQEGSDLKTRIDSIVENYNAEIGKIANNSFDAPSSSQSSTSSTQTSASTQSALSVLHQITTPAVITQLITPVFTKKTLAPELVDFTFTKCFYKSTDPSEILENNNRFGILKFACANGIPIGGKPEKLHYSLKELEWMLEQDPGGASTKGSTRRKRFETLFECAKHPIALHLFDIIYDMLCVSKPGAFVKICAVGGNVLRAFFLALRCVDTCSVFAEWDPATIGELGAFAKNLPHLDVLCDKSSDSDFTGYRKMSEEEHAQYGRTMERVLNSLCENNATCTGLTEFPLIRIKSRIFESGKYFIETCGDIADNSETMRAANHFFPNIQWFSQMIPDEPIKQIRKPKQIPFEIYKEIEKLYCTLQLVKKRNALLTSINSDVISQGNFSPHGNVTLPVINRRVLGDLNVQRFNNLTQFTKSCCEIFFNVISPNVSQEDSLQDIQQIVEKITPAATRAMFSILDSNETGPIIERVLSNVCNQERLSQTGINVFTDTTSKPLWANSTCIAVGSQVEDVSDTQKSSSAFGRAWFSRLHEGHPFKKHLCVSINTLRFTESTKSIEDMKESGEQRMSSQSFATSPRLSSSISLSIQRQTKPTPLIYTKNFLNELKLEDLQNIQREIKATGPKGGVSTRKNDAIDAILKKQNSLGGSKTRKCRHKNPHRTRKQRSKITRMTRRTRKF